MTAHEADSSVTTPDQGYVRSTELLLLAGWCGLLIGLIEVSIRALRFFQHQIAHASSHVVWMAPLADMLLFIIGGGILLLIAKCFRKPISWRMTIFVFSSLALLGPLFFYGRLHWIAVLLLATGAAMQISRFVVAHLDIFRSIIQHTTKWMVAIIVGLTVAVHGWLWLGERIALANLPPASPSAPNVLLIVLDTVRAKSLSLYGHARPTTPQLERLAKTGVTFERALSTSPWTLPSHASMFTGRFPHELTANWQTPLDDTYPTLAEVFSRYGYVAAGFVANVRYCSYDTGLGRGFVHYEDNPLSLGLAIRSSWLARTIIKRVRHTFDIRQEIVRKTAAELNEDFLRWLSHKGQRPFFVFLNYDDAHWPYLPPKPFDTKFGPPAFEHRPLGSLWTVHPEKWPPQMAQAELNAYEGSIAYLDHHLGLLFDELQNRGVLENTLVIVTADHGEQFGEHGLFEHANSLYRSLLHVPLVISFPSQVPKGIRVDEPVSLRDLSATVADLVKFGDEFSFPGNSLGQYWDTRHELDGPPVPLLAELRKGIHRKDWEPVSKGDMKSVVVDGVHYIQNGDGNEELYDFDKDVKEERDLAISEEGRQKIGQLRPVLDRTPAPAQPVAYAE